MSVEILIEAAFGYGPYDDSPAWTDITSYVAEVTWRRGRNTQLDRVENGGGDLLLKDPESHFDSRNTASPFYPNVKANVPVRGFLVVGVTQYPLFRHFVKRWPRSRRISSVYTERRVPTVDAFGLFASQPIRSEAATLTTALGSNKDLTLTAVEGGSGGNNISLEYQIDASVSSVKCGVTEKAIRIRVNGSSHTAQDVMTKLQTDSQTPSLVTVELAPGSNGSGVISAAMAATNLTGGAGADLAAELTGSRVGRLLDKAGYPSALRLIGSGKSMMPAETVPLGADARVLDNIQDAFDAEDGLGFVDAQGRVQFIDRHQLLGIFTTSEAEFSDDRTAGADMVYLDLAPVDETALLFNEWTVSREGGIPQTALDQTSIDDYTRTAQTPVVKLTTDNEVRDRAQWKLAQFKDPLAVIDSITLRPETDAQWILLAGLELGDRVTIDETPPGFAAPIVADYQVQQIDVRVPQGKVGVTWKVGVWPVNDRTYLVLDDSTLGQLDAGNVLAA